MPTPANSARYRQVRRRLPEHLAERLGVGASPGPHRHAGRGRLLPSGSCSLRPRGLAINEDKTQVVSADEGFDFLGFNVRRYNGKARPNQWLFGHRDSGAYIRKFAWSRIVRHQLVKGTSSPDDPALVGYWAERRRKAPPPPMDTADLRLLNAQHRRCPLCGWFLLHADHEPQAPRGGSNGSQLPARR